MVNIFYNLILSIVLVVGLPVWIFISLKEKYKQGIRRKLVMYSKDDSQSYVMVHGVSVGEINAAIPFIEHLKKKHLVLVTSSTLTGYENARKKLFDVEIEYFPLDFIWSIKKFFKLHSIKKIYILETEIWPNFVKEAKKSQIPVYIINGRISSKSFPKYKMLKPFLRSYFADIETIYCGSKTDKVRFETLGVNPSKIHVTASMKFDAAILAKQKLEEKKDKIDLIFDSDACHFVAGSTQESENFMMLELFLKLKKQIKNLKLILVPRKPITLKSLIPELKEKKISYDKVSSLSKHATFQDVLLVDTIGDLFNFYFYADIVFVGKSLVKKGGGQNPIEPSVLGKAVFMGPSTENFQDIVTDLVDKNGMRVVNDIDELYSVFLNYLLSKEKRIQMGLRAQQLILNKTSACTKILQET